MAISYFDSDFDFEELLADGEEFMNTVTNSSASSMVVIEHDDESIGAPAWNDFHTNHSTANFFRPKRYIPTEFPQALSLLQSPSTFLEVGCGAGAALFPILKARSENENAVGVCKCVAIDVSYVAVDLLKGEVEKWNEKLKEKLKEKRIEEGLKKEDVECFVCDISKAPPPIPPSSITCIFLIFCLSSIPPSLFPPSLKNLHTCLKKGGLLCFRDYGLYDMTMLRFKKEQYKGGKTFRRGDGTLSTFFEVEESRKMFEEAGFEIVECRYALVENFNRKKGVRLRRCFLHAFLRKV